MYQGDEAEKDRNKVWNISDITDSDVEKVICSGIPVNKMGNSKRCAFYSGRNISARSGSADSGSNYIINHKFPVERFDLITLEFLLYRRRCRMMIHTTDIIIFWRRYRRFFISVE